MICGQNTKNTNIPTPGQQASSNAFTCEPKGLIKSLPYALLPPPRTLASLTLMGALHLIEFFDVIIHCF